LRPAPYIIRVIKSRRSKWAEQVACMVEMKNAYKILVRKPGGKRLEGLGIYGRIMIGWILKK
jgi:hypothetical protein